ncbi:hypothetical protein [Amaricoccus macauensis]|uniref:hypothetical protein n=1 Tax=Amaricoccus macauensis TaxID=57001 RepID=UPI003C7DB251
MGVRITGAMLAVGLAVTACAPQPVSQEPGANAGSDYCVGLYQRLDFAKQLMSTPTGVRDNATIPPTLRTHIAALQQYKCLTRPDDLRLAEEAPGIENSGAAIDPVTIHVGAVTDMAADANAREFFESRGIKTLSVGQPGLGRRIYIGAFTTAGGRDSALALARQAGFNWPYVITYGPYMRP